MSSEIKIKCRNPHEFLISIIYSLSYASRKAGPVLHRSLLGLGYIFVALDIPSVFNMPAPDFLLVNTRRKIVVAVECKGDTVEDRKLKKKFSDPVEDAIKSVVQDDRNEYKIEFVIHTFDIFANHYTHVAHNISEELGKDVLIWTTTAVPQVMADSATGGTAEYYTLRKYTSQNYSVKHYDNELERLLAQGILISESDIACNPLVDPDVEYKVLFYELSEYTLRAALSDKYRGRRIRVVEFTNDIKRDYQSIVKIDRLIGVITDIFEVFHELGEIKRSSMEIVFKKRPRINEEFIKKFDDIRKTIINKSESEAKKYIRELKTRRRK